MPWSRVTVVASYALVLVLTVELAVWESFLSSARPFGSTFPVAALLAVVGNVGVGVAGARVMRSRGGAVLPGVLWLVIALRLGSRRAEGDAVVTGSVRGFAFLLLGTIAAAAVVGGLGSQRATPGGPVSR